MRAAEVLARAARQDRELGVRARDAFTTSFTVPSPPITTSSESRASRASLREVPRELREHLLAAQPELGGPPRSFGQRFPVAPLPDAGLTRKRISGGANRK